MRITHFYKHMESQAQIDKHIPPTSEGKTKNTPG